MSKNTTLIILLGIAIILAITNPTIDTHKAKVKEKFYGQLNLEDRVTEGGNNYEKAGSVLGTALGLSIIDKMIDGIVSSDNFVFFSLTRVTYKDKSRIIGVGFLGNVFITQEIEKPN